MSSRSKLRKKSFKCGHKGFGAFCHRCDHAEKLEALAEKGKRHITHKKPNPATGKVQSKKWTVEEMRNEADRLRKEGRF